MSLWVFAAVAEDGPAAASPAAGSPAAGSPERQPADAVKAAERLNRQGRHDEALGATDAYLRAHPDDPAGRFLRGVILTDLGRDGEAVETFTGLTVDHPEMPQPYNNLGVLYAQSGQLQRARESLELAVEADPADPVALENLGDVYVRLAVDHYARAAGIDPASRGLRKKLTLARSLAAAESALAGPAESPAAAAAR